MSIRITIEGNDWSEIRLQLADALESVRRVPAEAPRTAQEPLTAAPASDEPPWPVETIQEAAQRVFPDAERNDKPVCGVHHKEMEFRPAGVSKRTGKPYRAFYGCPERDCKVTQDAA